jgi:hypothetical protein
VSDEKHGSSLFLEEPKLLEALLHERFVPDRKDLVQKQNVGVQLDRQRECEPRPHPR